MDLPKSEKFMKVSGLNWIRQGCCSLAMNLRLTVELVAVTA
jgi:hypothetical protein